MSLLSVDISKVKRLSLRDVKLPAPETNIRPLEILKPILVETVAYTAPEPKTETIKPTDRSKLVEIAKTIIGLRNNYYKEVIVAKLKQETKVDEDRAERGFYLMLQAGVIEITNVDTYYLTDSTPF